MNVGRTKLFFWIFFLDSVLTLAVVLVAQSLTVGFDPIFANPIIIAVASVLSMAIGSYVPFLLLYRVVFEAFLMRNEIGPVALCWALLAPLLVVSVAVTIASFGAALMPIDFVLPIGLGALNVLIFYIWRAEGLSDAKATQPKKSP